jgi:hypothetical protein
MDCTVVTYVVGHGPVEHASPPTAGPAPTGLVASGPAYVSREIAPDMTPRALSALVADAGPCGDVRGRSWSAPVDWLVRTGAESIDPAMAGHLVVRVGWPPDAAAEAALLTARLVSPSLRVAVGLGPDSADDAFRYFDRLGLRWVAHPRDPHLDAWGATLERLVGRWCFDRRSRTTLEPVLSGFAAILADRLGRPWGPWRCRVVDLRHQRPPAIVPWTPSVHALLVAMPSAAPAWPLAGLQRADAGWMALLAERCAAIDAADLDALCHAPTAEVRR